MATLGERRRAGQEGGAPGQSGRRIEEEVPATWLRKSFKRGELHSNRGMATIYRVLDGLGHKCVPQQR